jgi:multimeric flavodoxin WrbA
VTAEDEGAKDGRIILGIVGSLRVLGNCELFVKQISASIPFTHELRLVRLPSLAILPCNGCYRCIEHHTCPLKDDLPFLLDQISAADALVIASPVYFFGAHASIKQLLDRAFSFFGVTERMKRKPCILVNTYGMKERIGVAPQTLLALASFLCLDVKSSVNIHAALPGDVLTDERHVLTAKSLGSLLFGEKADIPKHGCPFCGNDIVRMRKDDVICTLCHGSFNLGKSGRAQEGKRGATVDDIETIRAHREWLMGMKARFLANRKELRRLSHEYKDIGHWVKPGQ